VVPTGKWRWNVTLDGSTANLKFNKCFNNHEEIEFSGVNCNISKRTGTEIEKQIENKKISKEKIEIIITKLLQ
jgi:hypothetical protein